MTSLRLSPDDPRLTAYALGELAAPERDAVEASLAFEPELRARVDEIRAMGARLEAALADEAAADIILPPATVRGITPAATALKGGGGAVLPGRTTSKLLRFPILYVIAGGLAAACLAFLFVVRPEVRPTSVSGNVVVAAAPGSAATAAPSATVPGSTVGDDPDVSGARTPDSVPPMRVAAAGSPQLEEAPPAAFPIPERIAAPDVSPGPAPFRADPFTARVTEPSISPTLAPSTPIVAPALKTLPSITSRETHRPGSIAAIPGNATSAATPEEEAVAEPDATSSASGALGSVPWGGGFVSAARVPRSTFTAPEGLESYRTVAAALQAGRLPPKADVRPEELLNHFLGAPESRHSVGAGPVVAALECAVAPWNPAHRLLRIGIVGRAAPDASPALAAMIIADAVTVQVEFNPARVASYRLIGYESPGLRAQLRAPNVPSVSFKAGQTLTALYELVPAAPGESPAQGGYAPVRHLGYAPDNPDAPDLLTLRVRFLDVMTQRSRRIDMPLVDRGTAFAAATGDFAFAAAVAQFAMILRETPQRGSVSVDQLREWVARAAASPKRTEFDQWLERASPLLGK